MKRITTALALTISGIASAAKPAPLTPAAQQHISRVSSSLTALRKAPSNHQTNVASNRAFELLLKDTSPSGDEALAALAGHYLGDSTEPECEILARGNRMIPLLQRFDRNPPLVQLPVSNTSSRSELITQIKTGARCG